jgi:ABC-type nitrate/sulfonate/bicarbonate transport system permease component
LLTENMFAGLVVIMILGALFTSGLQALERRLMPWQREELPASADGADIGGAGAKG